MESSKNVKMKRVVSAKKIVVFVLIILAIIFAIFMFLGNNVTEDNGTAYNKNKSFTKEQDIDGVVFKKIKCIYDGKDSLLSYVIVNNTKDKIYLNNYNVIVRDKGKNIITKIVVNSSQYIEPGDEFKMANSVIGVDLSDAYYMELKLKVGE